MHVWHVVHAAAPRCARWQRAFWTRHAACASPASPRHAQPDCTGGGSAHKHITHSPITRFFCTASGFMGAFFLLKKLGLWFHARKFEKATACMATLVLLMLPLQVLV